MSAFLSKRDQLERAAHLSHARVKFPVARLTGQLLVSRFRFLYAKLVIADCLQDVGKGREQERKACLQDVGPKNAPDIFGTSTIHGGRKGRKHDCTEAAGRVTQEMVTEERKACCKDFNYD